MLKFEGCTNWIHDTLRITSASLIVLSSSGKIQNISHGEIFDYTQPFPNKISFMRNSLSVMLNKQRLLIISENLRKSKSQVLKMQFFQKMASRTNTFYFFSYLNNSSLESLVRDFFVHKNHLRKSDSNYAKFHAKGIVAKFCF